MKRAGLRIGGLAAVLAWLTISSAAQGAGDNRAPLTLEGGRDFLTIPGKQWKLIFNDEFGEDHLDTKKWTIGLSWTGDDGSHRHHNDSYASYIADDDVVLSGGMLRLLTRKQDVKGLNGKTFHYTEGFIQTDGKFSYKYGYCEIRAKVPVSDGPGLWPAFWLLSSGWPPEDDVAEFWTGRPAPQTHQGYAYSGDHGKVQWQSFTTDKIRSGFHTYGMEWGPGYQIMNIDGQPTSVIHGSEVTDRPLYLILNSGVTAKPTTPNASTVFPNEFDVYYVRVYSRPDAVSVLDAGFEYDSLSPWRNVWNNAAVVRDHAHGGKMCLKLSSSPASVEQTLFGLKPNTTYRLTGWADAYSGDELRLGVKTYGGAEMAASQNQRGYRLLSQDFTTGSKSTSAVIYCYKPSGKGIGYFDEIQIAPVGEKP